MKLDQIRHKLDLQVKNLPAQAEGVPPIDWPKAQISHPVRRSGSHGNRPGDSANLHTALEALKQRRATHPGMASPPSQPPLATQGNSEIEERAVQEIQIHVKRLRSLADKINLLSSEQEHLLGEMRTVQGRLELLQPYVEHNSAAKAVFPEINLEGAVLAWADSHRDTNLVLTYRSARVPQPHQDAQDLANHLRGTYGARGGTRDFSWSGLVAGFGSLWQEPAELLGLIGERVWRFRQLLRRRVAASAVTSETAPTSKPWASFLDSISVMEMVFWFGGGFIGRLALNLMLSAFPVLWSVAVAGLTGITAYALYLAILAPRRDFGVAYRLFLAIAGLFLGGRL